MIDLQGSETVWRMLAERKIVTPIKNGEASKIDIIDIIRYDFVKV